MNILSNMKFNMKSNMKSNIKSNKQRLLIQPFLSTKHSTYFYSPQFRNRLENFYHTHSPHLISRIHIILEAYQDQPQFLFGDLDHNYHTHASTRWERYLWKREPLPQKHIRVKVAQDYIYRQLPTHLLLSNEHLHKDKANNLSNF